MVLGLRYSMLHQHYDIATANQEDGCQDTEESVLDMGEFIGEGVGSDGVGGKRWHYLKA